MQEDEVSNKVAFIYGDSLRPAVGLTIELTRTHTEMRIENPEVILTEGRNPDAVEVQVEDHFCCVTDGSGFPRDSTNNIFHLQTGEMITIKRGVHQFSGEQADGRFEFQVSPLPGQSVMTFEIKPEQWPEKYKELKQKLNIQLPRDPNYIDTRVFPINPLGLPGGPTLAYTPKTELTRAANTVLEKFHNRNIIGCLTKLFNINDRPPDQDNPHILAASLLCALSVSRVFTLHRGLTRGRMGYSIQAEREALHIIQGGITALRRWLGKRAHPSAPGYFFRWAQSALDSREIEADWKAEPSLDEYSGLLMGLVWTFNLIGTHYSLSEASHWSAFELDQFSNCLRNIDAYLQGTKGWLMRPGFNDMTVRGAGIITDSYPLTAILKRCGGSFTQESPLDIPSSVVHALNKSEREIKEMEDRSNNPLTDGVTAANLRELAKKYKEQLGLFFSIRDIEKDISFIEWLTSRIGVFSFLLFGVPFLEVPSSVIGVFSIVTAVLTSEISKKISEFTDRELWDYCAQSLGTPFAVDAGGYNTYIFDRLSLAACWSATPQFSESFNKRATRPTGGETDSWRNFAIASKVWMGADFKSDEILAALLRLVKAYVSEHASDDDALYTHTPIMESFVCGWSMICLALDMDPGLNWGNIIDERLEMAIPTEFDQFDSVAPSLSFSLLLTNAETVQSPYVWCIPILIRHNGEKISAELLQEERDHKCRVNFYETEDAIYKNTNLTFGDNGFNWHFPKNFTVNDSSSLEFIMVSMGWSSHGEAHNQLCYSKALTIIQNVVKEDNLSLSADSHVLANRMEKRLNQDLLPEGLVPSFKDSFIGSAASVVRVGLKEGDNEQKFGILLKKSQSTTSSIALTGKIRFFKAHAQSGGSAVLSHKKSLPLEGSGLKII